MISNCSFVIRFNEITSCTAVSFTAGIPASSIVSGGGISIVLLPYVFKAGGFSLDSLSTVVSNTSISISNSTLTQCIVKVSSQSVCADSNAYGGAISLYSPQTNILISFTTITNSSTLVECGGVISKKSIGGGLSVRNASSVMVSKCQFLSCSAIGSTDSNAFFVSGGAISVINVSSLSVADSIVLSCSVSNAIASSTVMFICGGGAIGIQNAWTVYISNSLIRGSRDSCNSGHILLMQMLPVSSHVYIEDTPLLVERSDVPAFRATCGFNCSLNPVFLILNNSNITSALQPSLNSNIALSQLLIIIDSRIVFSSLRSFVACTSLDATQLALFKSVDSVGQSIFSCQQCNPFQIAQTSNVASIDSLLNPMLPVATCMPVSPSANRCPYGFAHCTTGVNVTSGFWAQFFTGNLNSPLTNATRCPSNYCGCSSMPSCLIPPPLSPNYSPNALCSGNRSGILCGGCIFDFTQSLDGISCIPNDVCIRSLGWVWAVTVFGYSIFSLFVVVNAMRRKQSGLIPCIIFYYQMASFSSEGAHSILDGGLSQTYGDSRDQTSFSYWLGRISQFNSLASLYKFTCFAPNMTIYNTTAALLIGPVIVLVTSFLWTWLIKRLHSRFPSSSVQRIIVSYQGSAASSSLFLFSSVATVIFKLIRCQHVQLSDGPTEVLFIDGNEKCHDKRRTILVFFLVLLCLFPLLFAIALVKNWLRPNSRHAVCCNYTDQRYYWGALALAFRLIMSLVFSFVEYLSVRSNLLTLLSAAMLVLLVHNRPHILNSTFYVDILCYFCLSEQFALGILLDSSDSLGVSVDSSNAFFTIIQSSSLAQSVVR